MLSIQKIGHTGTLDPDATGVLTVCIGRATRLAQYTNEFDKEYKVVMRLGISTDTQDATGRGIKETEEFKISREQIENAITVEDAEGLNLAGKLETRLRSLEQMTGWMPSAIINNHGYSLVRDGRTIDREAIEGIKGDFFPDDTVAVIDNSGALKAIGKAMCSSNEARCGSNEKIIKIERVLISSL